jgi:deoxycytidylate deaminase
MFYDHKFRRKMKKLTIYIAKHRHSTLMSCPSLPCSNCTKKIKELGIKKIVYVDKSGQIQKCLSQNYFSDYVCPGYKELDRRNIKVI